MPEKKIQTPDNLPVVLLDLQYLPPVPYFFLLVYSKKVLLDLREHYIKQSYRNRCRILTSNGTHELVIPVSKPHQHVPMNEIRIDYSQSWAKIHWKAIRSAYGKSPWYLHYSGDIHDLIMEENIFLKDLNLKLIKYFLEILDIQADISFPVKYEKKIRADILDFRSAIHPKRAETEFTFYRPVAYAQNFGVNFAASLSIIDLVFNEGPNSREILSRSYCPGNQENK